MRVQSTSSTHLTDVTNEVNFHISPPSRDPPPPTPPDSTSSAHQLFTCRSLFSPPLRFSYPLYHQPLPSFRWADGGDVWRVMLEKETKLTYRRDPDMFERHAGLDARMRSILLDWLIEVSATFKFNMTFFTGSDDIGLALYSSRVQFSAILLSYSSLRQVISTLVPFFTKRRVV